MTTQIADRVPVMGALERAEKLLLDTNRRTDDFLAMLGHEMRNPLSALGNALQVWERASLSQVQMEELRHLMQRQVRQLVRLSDDLLDVARIAQGKLELRLSQVELKRLIQDACEEVRPFIDLCGHALTVRMPPMPILMQGDASRLVQVFANLLQNAAKFTQPSGSLTVTVELREGMAVVRVRDNGPGIEEQMLPAIFEASRPLEENYTAANDGLGIGLRLVKAIVELHRGEVTARSEGAGLGSEFTVHLPVLPDASHDRLSALPTADASEPRPPARRIVIVDDDRSSALLLAWLLRSIGQTVSVVDNGAAAIPLVLEERPQVVFLDILMGGMSGLEVARQLRSHAELDGLVLFALSGNGSEEDKRQAIEAGFDNYFVKPTCIEALAQALARIPPHAAIARG
jgi:CheY-like chemotaxis protein/two-component sensor histidine kinase